VRNTRLALCLVTFVTGTACTLIDAIDNALHPWPRYKLPSSKISVAMPAQPRFTTEALSGSPCGDLSRTAFAVRSQFALYSGYFIPMTDACRQDPSHAIGLQMLVTPSTSSEWRQETSDVLEATGAVSARRITYRREGSPPVIRTTETYVLPDGVLGLVTEAQDLAENQSRAEKFLRGVRLNAAE
jgi:hypothetical protein